MKVNSNNDGQEQEAAPTSTTEIPTSDGAGVVAATATAANNDTNGDFTIAQMFQAIDTLTNVFQFPRKLAEEAVNEVGPDTTEACNWILDQNLAEDKGGPIVPISDCPHMEDHVLLKVEDIVLSSQCSHFLMQEENKSICSTANDTTMRGEGKCKMDNETGICPSGENWLCLHCGVTRCSRYVNGHCKVHWESTKAAELEKMSSIKSAHGDGDFTEPVGHCLAVSLEDLSVWCYKCQAYLNHPSLTPMLKRLEELKFGDEHNEK